MGKLDLAVGYLSGAMEYVADGGVEWRQEFKRQIRAAGLKIDFFDPTQKPSGTKAPEDKQYQAKLQEEGRWEELQEYVDDYRRLDLRMVDNSDFLVVMINHTVPQWGTAHETYMCEAQHKPCFFINPGGLRTFPRWLMGVADIAPRCNVYETIEEVVAELVKLDSGEIPMSKEWILLRKWIEENRMFDY